MEKSYIIVERNNAKGNSYDILFCTFCKKTCTRANYSRHKLNAKHIENTTKNTSLLKKDSHNVTRESHPFYCSVKAI